MSSEFYTEKCLQAIVVLFVSSLLGCAHVGSESKAVATELEAGEEAADLQEPVGRWGSDEAESEGDAVSAAPEVALEKTVDQPKAEPEPVEKSGEKPEPEPEPEMVKKAAPAVEKPAPAEEAFVPETPVVPEEKAVAEEPPPPPPKPVQTRKTHYQAALKLIEGGPKPTPGGPYALKPGYSSIFPLSFVQIPSKFTRKPGLFLLLRPKRAPN